MATRVLSYGLGVIGLAITRLVLQRADVQLVAAVDADPRKNGRDVGDLLGFPTTGIVITDNIKKALTAKPDIVLHATSSFLEHTESQYEPLLRAGASIISTCEELAYPWLQHAETAQRLDKLARDHKSVLLGTGINPGYVMDTLPLFLTAPCAQVRSVRILRVVDAAKRRAALQRKVGAGLSHELFAQKVNEGSVRHTGLHESMHMITSALGWKIDRTSYSLQPVQATHEIVTDYTHIKPGTVAGIHQTVQGFQNERRVISLDLQIYAGAPNPRDEIEIDGDPSLYTRIAGGLHGDSATGGLMINAIAPVLCAAPGLADMSSIGITHWRNPQADNVKL